MSASSLLKDSFSLDSGLAAPFSRLVLRLFRSLFLGVKVTSKPLSPPFF